MARSSRREAIKALGNLTQNREEIRSKIIKALIHMLKEYDEKGKPISADDAVVAIESISQYGSDAKEVIPLLKQLKLNQARDVREAADSALRVIELDMRVKGIAPQ